MNKRDSRKIAMSKRFTAGELLDLIQQAKNADVGQMSRVNPMVPLSKALDIYIAAIPTDRDKEVDPGRLGNVLIISNILRDCA